MPQPFESLIHHTFQESNHTNQIPTIYIIETKRKWEKPQLDLIYLHHETPCPCCIQTCLLLVLENTQEKNECVTILVDLISHTIQTLHSCTKETKLLNGSLLNVLMKVNAFLNLPFLMHYLLIQIVIQNGKVEPVAYVEFLVGPHNFHNSLYMDICGIP